MLREMSSSNIQQTFWTLFKLHGNSKSILSSYAQVLTVSMYCQSHSVMSQPYRWHIMIRKLVVVLQSANIHCTSIFKNRQDCSINYGFIFCRMSEVSKWPLWPILTAVENKKWIQTQKRFQTISCNLPHFVEGFWMCSSLFSVTSGKIFIQKKIESNLRIS